MKRSPIEMIIDQACGVDRTPPPPRKLTDEEKEMCSQLGRDVLSDLRYAYPDVVKTRPTTWPLHLRNTISIKAEAMLRKYLENAKAVPIPEKWVEISMPLPPGTPDAGNSDAANSGSVEGSIPSAAPFPENVTTEARP